VGRVRFVQPETVRLDISDGEWIEIKKQLTWAEQQDFTNAGVDTKVSGPEISVKWGDVALQRLLIWLVDWSLLDANGKNVPISRDSISALDTETGEEIVAAMNKYVAARAEEKKATAGKTSSAD
jgi:hypothetical protein